MTWTEFLIHILTAHAQTLHRLAAFFGEAELLEILETAGETSKEAPSPFELKDEWLTTTEGPETPTAYLELEGAVHDMHLSAVLEFHLWTYPFYRLFIEKLVNLKAKIPNQQGSAVLELLVEEAIVQAKAWTRNLPIPPELALQTNSIAQVPWIRFRTTVLGKIGRRPIIALG